MRSLGDLIFGKPLRSSSERAEQIGPLKGVPIFGLDALSSAAYGPEAAMTLLIPLGALGLHYILPLSTAIVVLLLIVYVSYLQTIAAYPGGGGSYTVARENLGEGAGLLAAAALMIDYVLVVAVGISAGVGALDSAAPSLLPHTLAICLVILAFIAVVNLRGMSEAGNVFMVPTILFVSTLAIAIVVGVVRTFTSGGHPAPVVAPPHVPPATAAVGAWVLLQAFASGCTAMTGVEAVSNGVRAFREPGTRNARITLTIIIGILVLLLLGIAYLAQVYHIGATDPGSANYQSVLSQLLVAVFGRGIFYYVSIAGILLVLAFSANTAFADFPRLCQIVAGHKYLPSSFASRGRRLVFSQGIYVLTALSALLLIIFGGVTDRLIPLFAVGAFLAFTLSQAGMVVHWKRNRTKGWRTSMALNGLGAAATLVTVLVVLAAKFVAGAWITALLIPAMVITMFAIRRHYARIERELRTEAPLQLMHMRAPIVIVPIKGWDRATKKALSFAVDLSPDVLAVYVEINEGSCEPLRQSWEQLAVEPAKKAGFVPPQMEVMYSPFRQVLSKIVEVARREATLHPDRQIMVVIPELVENHWYHFFLHSQRAAVLKTMLYFLGNRHIVVANVPWYLEDHPEPAPANAAMPPEPSTAESPNA